MHTSYIVTFTSDDRPGLVEQLSRVIENNGGNWHESRLSQLGGMFAGLILISLPREGASALETELKNLSASGLSVQLTPTGDRSDPVAGRNINLTVMGPDRLGIVRKISHALANRHINVLQMDSQVNSAPMSAEMIFTAHIEAWIPETTDSDDLRDALDAIADNMTLEIDLNSPL